MTLRPLTRRSVLGSLIAAGSAPMLAPVASLAQDKALQTRPIPTSGRRCP